MDEVKIEYLMETRSAWFLEKFEQVINYRYEALVPTMITTNEQIEQFLPRLRSRLAYKRRSKLIWSKAPDYRGTTTRNMSPLLPKIWGK